MAQSLTTRNKKPVLHVVLSEAELARVVQLAGEENRSKSRMAALLLEEALNARQAARLESAAQQESRTKSGMAAQRVAEALNARQTFRLEHSHGPQS
ncbi:MAG: hypothetical protein OIF57_04625 [Marinobacterium sp.]|nr:hypothetical protein [Marinobacterium sp.]